MLSSGAMLSCPPDPSSAPDVRDVRDRIIQLATSKFLHFGFSKVSMDEIASELAISKRTLYTHFESKETLLQVVVECIFEASERVSEAILEQDDLSVLEKLEALIEHSVWSTERFSTHFIEDIYRHSAKTWQLMLERAALRGDRFRMMCSKSRERGIFRSDINEEVVFQVMTSAYSLFLQPEKMKLIGLPPREILENLHRIFFEGLLTSEARRGICSANTEPSSQIKAPPIGHLSNPDV